MWATLATPFANIFIHDDRRAEGFGEDLFPATFILQLTPPMTTSAPGGVFGTHDEADNSGIPLVRPLEQTRKTGSRKNTTRIISHASTERTAVPAQS